MEVGLDVQTFRRSFTDMEKAMFSLVPLYLMVRNMMPIQHNSKKIQAWRKL